MSNGSFPSLLVLMIGVVGEAVNDEAVYTMKGEMSVWRVGDGHADHGDVAVWWFA